MSSKCALCSHTRLTYFNRASIALFRRQMGIRVEGAHVPNPTATFESIPADQNGQEKQFRSILLHNIEASDFKEPTAIQMQAIPSLLAGRDVLGTAPTGSGKTAAFLIPMLLRLAQTQSQSSIRSIIVVPTRELAVQIEKEVNRLTVGYGFQTVVLSKSQTETIRTNFRYTTKYRIIYICTQFTDRKETSIPIDILIATPLRLVHLIQTAKIDLCGYGTPPCDCLLMPLCMQRGNDYAR